MKCLIVEADERFSKYDLDVVAAINYEEDESGKLIRMDVFDCNDVIRLNSFNERAKYQFLVIPENISDILSNIVVIGEVWSDEYKIAKDGYIRYNVDRGMLQLTIQDYYVRKRYIKFLKEIEETRSALKRLRK